MVRTPTSAGQKAKLKFQSLALRLTGFSIPLFGVQWTPPKPERDTVQRLVKFLEARRVLYVDFHLELEDEVARSVIEIRDELTKALQDLSDGSGAEAAIRAMRAACRKFLSEPRPHIRTLGSSRWHHRDGADEGFFVALGELRATFGLHIAALAYRYGIDVEPELASIFPAEPEDDARGPHD